MWLESGVLQDREAQTQIPLQLQVNLTEMSTH